MVGGYRALLIGNSNYPADGHNLQTLRGPIKDIAAVNRALIDKDTGLFADADVTLLPEVTSTRAIRALGKFFASGGRDDVLLLYFSGHGKLDQTGRLHLCMQDTDTTDLLSTAVSNVRINEFADASRARNIVIILDCCYAGAFRGGDLGGAVAGPGRYVLSSCRGTQLANDATVDNGTSFFTQHLVDGLLTAADSDEDGYVGFSDIYAYVDRQLREAGKQIPARRVDGDGDLRLAKRPRRETVLPPPEPRVPADPTPDGAAGADRRTPVAVSAAPAPPQPAGAGDPDAATADKSPPKDSSPTGGPRFRWTRGRVLAAVAAVIVAGGAGVAALLLRGADADRSTSASGTYTAAAPWRLRVDGTAYGQGCAVTLTKQGSGDTLTWNDIYSVARFQVPDTGSFRWQANDSRCLVTPFVGAGSATLPLLQETNGDTDAIKAPPRRLAVQIVDNKGSNCTIRLFDAANGDGLDLKQWEQGDENFTLDPAGRSSVYVSDDNCIIRVSAQG
jgi:hypothetical protein